MNINQSQLTPIERDLISRVLDFPFEVGNTTICLNSISSKIELDLTILSYYKDEEVNCDSLTKKKEMLVEEINKLQPVMNAYMQARWKGENVKEPIHHGLPLSDYIGLLKGKVSSIDDLCKNNSKFQTPLLGSFSPNNQKVYLFLNNIKDAANRRLGLKKEYVLITTFIHEMFHAWNFFACGNKERTVREIDEAMVEFATLYFLRKISQTHKEFDPILNWAEQSIRSKQTAFGETAAYGYGYYLYSLVNNYESQVLQLLAAYIRKSGLIGSTALVASIKAKLYPIYPDNEEMQVYKMLQQLLFRDCKIPGQVWSKSGKTNIVTKDGYILFEDNVDSISRLEVGHVHSDLYLIENGGVLKIYGESHDKWFPVFDDEFDKVKPLKYGKYYIVLVKRHHDGKAFILCPLDLLMIRDISDIRAIHNRITLENCMTADDFLIRIKDDDTYYLSDDDFPLIDENKWISIFKLENNQYVYIFPFTIQRVKMIDVDVSGFLRKADGRLYKLPTLFPFLTYGCQFVYILSNGKGCVYTYDGHRIGRKYNFFERFYPDNIKYVIIEKDGKYNVYSFEKMDAYFDKWFEYCDIKKANGEWIFKVKIKINGECKILDANGNDISDKYKEILEQFRLKLLDSKI